MKKSSVDNMFKGSGTYTEARCNVAHTLLCDEAHRLNEKSGMFHNQGEDRSVPEGDQEAVQGIAGRSGAEGRRDHKEHLPHPAYQGDEGVLYLLYGCEHGSVLEEEIGA